LKPRKVSIVGSADVRPGGAGRSNYELALTRANTAKAFLSRSLGIKPEYIETSSAGVTQADTKCPDKSPAAMLAECLSSSRRVDIEIEFE
jgi:outer membrane protein OmpA-like peptidoglycan-associated protein